jgi:hypothetical protein
MEHMEFMNVQEAKSVHLYKNTKEKLFRAAAIWFNNCV